MTENPNKSESQQQYGNMEADSTQEKMLNEFVEVLFQASNIDKEILKSKLTEAFIDWQNISKNPISSAVHMDPKERVKMTHIVADIFREKLFKHLKSTGYTNDQEKEETLFASINEALDKVLKYYESNYMYRG